jgi:hypothetical protein
LSGKSDRLATTAWKLIIAGVALPTASVLGAICFAHQASAQLANLVVLLGGIAGLAFSGAAVLTWRRHEVEIQRPPR